jgi:hypothetical protein
MFNNLANLFSDINFWGGVAEGGGKEFARQEEDKRKDVRELRNFVISDASKLDDENRVKVESAGESAEQIGSLIKGGRNVKSAAVKEATMFLIDEYGSAKNALEAAKKLSTQYETYGEPFDPITTLGFTDSQIGDRVAPTYAQIGRKYTTLRPLPTLSSVQLKSINDKTALDRIFGGKGVAELAIEEAKPLIGPTITDQTQEAFETLTPEKPFYSEYVLSNDIDGELERMNAAQLSLQSIPEAQRGPDFKSKERLIMDRIGILKKTKSATEDGDGFTVSERRSLRKDFSGLVQYKAGYASEFSPLGFWIPKHEQQEIVTMSDNYASGLVDLLNMATLENLKGMDPNKKTISVDPYLFIEQGAVNNLEVTLVAEQRDEETGEILVEKHLKYGASVLPRASTNQVVDPALAAAAGTTALPTSASNYTASTAVQTSLAGFKTSRTASARRANARAMMATLKQDPNLPDQASRDAAFETLTGMSFEDSQK